MDNTYENYGDVNPLEHGGIWIKKTGETEFEVIKHEPDEDSFYNKGIKDMHIVNSMLVDISDSWIEWNSVHDSCDTDMNDDISKILSVIWYYSPLNFGGNNEQMDGNELIEFLHVRGIEID